VFPLTEAIAADFRQKHPTQVVNVSSSSTGVGLERFCRGELDIADASRPMTQAEVQACASAGVTFIEMPVAYDAICVVVHPSNDWAGSMTTAELKMLWQHEAEGKVTRWSQVRKGWPDRDIRLFGPDGQSGTFDYFNEVINGAAKNSRRDYQGHVDDNRIIAAVEADADALGYVGFTYYEHDRSKLRAVAIDDLDERIGPGAVEPTLNNVGRGVYRPLSRPLFIYIRAASLDRPEVKQFAEFYGRFALDVAGRVGGVSLTARESELALARLNKRVTGTMFADPDEGDASLQMRLSRSQ
jgi:phosphate transport system substrate-binding protein